MSLLHLLRKFALERPAAACLSFDDETVSFADLHSRSSRLAHAMRAAGLGSGDRVVLIARNTPHHFELLFACAKIGAIALPINWRLSAGEVAGIMADALPGLLLLDPGFMGLVCDIAQLPVTIDLARDYDEWRDASADADPANEADPHAPLLLLYTSGTTGQPKGVTLSATNLSFVERMAREQWGFDSQSVNLLAMPLFHIGGIGYGMMALSQGGHTVLIQQPTPDAVFAGIDRHAVTHAFLVPAVIQMLVDAPGVEGRALGSLKRILYGASPISEAVLSRAIALFGCQFNHAYGMTETAGTVITLPPEDHDPGGPRAHRLRSCGLPVPWVELALVDPATGHTVPTGEVGEIRIRSGMVMRGYWGKPEETARTVTADGWLCTGDAAWRDTDGYVYIHDRYKDMIVSGGENIYPTEIENVLYSHPDVAEVAVIGVPHEKWGESPRAYVVLRASGGPDEADLIAYTRARLATYKCPTSVRLVESLPRNASGKILKRAMRDELWLKDPS